MKFRSVWLCATIICLSSICDAQTGKYFMADVDFTISGKNGQFEVSDQNTFIGNDAASVSSMRGEQLFYANYNYIWNSNGVLLTSDKKLTGGRYSANNVSIITINDSVYVAIAIFPDSIVNQLRYTHLGYTEVNIVNGRAIINLNRQSQYLAPTRVYGMLSIEDTVGGTWLVVRTSGNTFTSFYFNENCHGCKVKNSVIPVAFSEAFHLLPTNEIYEPYLIRSPSGNYIAAISEDGNVAKIGSNIRQTSEDWSILHLGFNKITGEVHLIDTIVYKQFNDLLQFPSEQIRRGNLRYSSNDSLAFYSYHYEKSGDSFNNSNPIYGVQLNKLNDPKLLYVAIKMRDSFTKYIPDVRDLLNYDVGKIHVISRLLFPNRIVFGSISTNGYRLPEKLNISEQVVPTKKGLNVPYFVGYTKYNYIRFKHIIAYDCVAKVNFEDGSDYGLIGTKLTVWVEEKAGSGVLKEYNSIPELTFTKNGDYYYRVVLKSDLGNYKEIYYDTIKVRIPPKPVANFLASDTLVCNHTLAVFNNFSMSKAFHPTNAKTLTWHFGDGDSLVTKPTGMVDQITHQYKQTGIYTVSLTYHNGFCDSTLVRKQYIHVVDAPSSGFMADNNRGCTPFTPKFTDTITEHVVKKEYYFSDVDRWEEISTSHFTHTFTKPGSFYTVQRLYGYTGCITQTDTAWFYVTQGITSADTQHVYVASYSHNQHIEVHWPTMDAATQYQVFRNNKPLKIVEGISFTDTVSAPNMFSYAVAALDSCGTASLKGRIGQAPYLQGKEIGDNESAMLWFSPYLNWETEVQYQLFKIDEQHTELIGSQNTLDTFNHQQFLVQGKSEQCYQIEAKSANGIWTSKSNTLCLPYVPFVFVPTAFSPNADGLNDEFKPISYGIVRYELTVYNRWGQRIHSSENKGWNGSDAPTGAYLFFINVVDNTGRKHHVSGSVSLVR